MSAPTCSTCRFWMTKAAHYYIPGEAQDADDDRPQRMCARIIHGNGRERPGKLAEPAMVCDGSGYAASLYTLDLRRD